MRKPGTWTVFLIMVALLCAGVAFAQTGSIQGTVTDRSGAVVQGAEVMARNVATNGTRTATSSATGAFGLTNLPTGAYRVDVRKESFKTFHIETVSVDPLLKIKAALH